jgi:hypothetical protein
LNGSAEAVFAWMTDKFEHRTRGTTKANPEDRGAYDSLREAEKAGITLDLLEKYFIQAIVDDYMQSWNVMRDNLRQVNPAKQPRQSVVAPDGYNAALDLSHTALRAESEGERYTGVL